MNAVTAVNNMGPEPPVELQRLLEGLTLSPISVGCSGATTLRAGPYILKLNDPEAEVQASRLVWLAGRLPVPRVFWQGSETLLIQALPGRDASEPDHDPALVVALLAEGLRRIHGLAAEDCPFDARPPVLLAAARQRLERGLVDEEDFDEERRGRSAADLWEELVALAPHVPCERSVFTHGDYCLPNILIDSSGPSGSGGPSDSGGPNGGARLGGFIDLGRAGLGDPYRDLALVERSIASNLGRSWVAPFFAAYGLREPDPVRRRFYLLLDEFF